MLVSRVDGIEAVYPFLKLEPDELAQLKQLISKGLSPNVDADEAVDAKRRAKAVAAVEQMYKFRRRREQAIEDVFGMAIFADPAWDMLLDLYLRTANGKEVSVSSACIGANAPGTTALRYIAELEKLEVIDRHPHPTDKRSYLVRLSKRAMLLMDDLCSNFADLMGQPA